jgi:DNA-directed RNA polymerase specialized sigma24 family protein
MDTNPNPDTIAAAPLDPLDLMKLCPRYKDDDLVQETQLALLEEHPATLADAQLVVSRARHRYEWRARMDKNRSRTIEIEPEADQQHDSPLQAQFRVIYDALEEMDRRVLYLKFICGLNSKETGAQLGISQPTLRKRLDHAINAARDFAQSQLANSV